MENSITETVMKNRRYNELMSHLFASLPAADERLKSCFTGLSTADGSQLSDLKSELDGLSGEVTHMQHDVDEFVSCSKDLIAILSILDCHDTPKAHEIQSCMDEIQRLSDKASTTVDSFRSELAQKIEKWRYAEQEIDAMREWLHLSEVHLRDQMQALLTEDTVDQLIAEQRQFHQTVEDKKNSIILLVERCKEWGLPPPAFQDLHGQISVLISSSQNRLQNLEDIRCKVLEINHTAAYLKTWLSELIVTLDGDMVLGETITERRSRAENICNQRHTKRRTLDELIRSVHQLSTEGLVLKDSQLTKVIEIIEESWSQMSGLFGKFVSSLVLAELEQLTSAGDQKPVDLIPGEAASLEYDEHFLASELQNQQVVCSNLDNRCQALSNTVEKCQHLLSEACDDIASANIHFQLTDVRQQSQLACHQANKWLSTLNETLPIACHIKKRQTQIGTWLCDVEAEINLLGDLPTSENVEQLRLYQQSVYMMERLLEDYQPVVDDLLIAAKEFSLMDSVSEKVQIRLAVDDIVAKFDEVKQSLIQRRTSLDTLCSTAVEEQIMLLHNVAHQLKSQLIFADPVMTDSSTILMQIAQNDNMKEELKCLASAVTSVSALFTQFDSPDVSNDALNVSKDEARQKLLALNELRDEIEAGLQKRAEQLCTALKAAETAEWGLQRAIDSVGKMKNHLMSITVHNTDSSSLTKDLDKLKAHVEEMVKMQQVVRELSGSVTDYAKVDLSQSQALPKSQCIAFDIHYEETMDLLKEKIRDHELVLKLVEDYENHYEAICTWMSVAEQRVIGFHAIADSVRTVRIQIEELKVFSVQLRAWNSELYKWNQTLAQICALGMPSEIAGLDLLMAQAADMNARWTKLTIAVERRETDLIAAYAKLGEVDAALDEMTGLIQEAESDLSAYGQVYGDPQCIKLQLAKIEALFKELASHRNLLRVLSDAVKSVIHASDKGNAVGCTPAFEKKTSEVEEMLDEVELKASETRAELRTHLLEVQGFIESATSLIRWFTDWGRHVLARSTIPLGALVDSARRQLNEALAFLANADGKYHEVRAMLLSGQDLLARCRSNDCHTITDTLQRLQVLSEDVQEKAGRYKSRMESHVRNVELFHRLMQIQVDWLSDAETRLFTLRRPSRLVNSAQQQLDAHRALMEEIAVHREPMKHVDLTGTYIKYLGSRCDFYQLGELLMMLRLRWKRLIRHATEIGQHLLRAFHQDKRFTDSWSLLCDWLEDVENRLQYQAVCTDSSSDAAYVHRVEAEFNNRLPIYLSTRRGGTVLLEHCAKVGESGSERQSLMNMLVTLTKRWNAVRTLITQSRHNAIKSSLSSGNSASAAETLIDWIDHAKLYLSKDQQVLGDMDTVSQLIDQHQNFQREAVMKRELIEQLLEIRRKESSVDPNLQKVAAEWETMIKLETDRWNTLQHALRLANSFNESIDAVLEWLPLAEEELAFRQIPDNEEDILQLMESHTRFDEDLHGQSVFVDELVRVGSEILESCHANAKRTVSYHMTSISTRWAQVLRRSSFRGQRLKDSLEILRNNSAQLVSLSQWLTDVYNELKSKEDTEIPQNVAAVKLLIKQHKTLHERLSARRLEVEQIRKRVQPQVSRLSADSVGHSDQNKTCLASEVVETWQSVWRMSCSRARRLDDVLQQCKANSNKKYQRMPSKTNNEVVDKMHDGDSNTSGDRIIPSSPRQPLSSLKLNCRDSPTAQRKITSTCCKSVECNTACLVHSDKSSRRQSESDSIPSSPQNRRRRNLNKTPNGGDAGTTVGHKTVACDGRKSNNAHGNTRKLSESELKKPSRAVHSPRGACCQKNVANCFVPINSGSESHESNRTVGGGKDKSASVAGSSETISARKGGHGVAHVNPNGGSFEGKRCVSSVSFAASDCATDGKSERSVNRRLPASGGNDGQALVHSSSSHVLSTNLAPRVILQDSRQCSCQNDKPVASAESIAEAIREELKRCQCPEGFPFVKIDDGKYKFGSRSRLCLVRFVNSTVTVRVGGGWMRLDEFLNAVDPCRVRQRRRLLPPSPDVESCGRGVKHSATFSSAYRNLSPSRDLTVRISSPSRSTPDINSSPNLSPVADTFSSSRGRGPVRGRDPVRAADRQSRKSVTDAEKPRTSRSLSRLGARSRQQHATTAAAVVVVVGASSEAACVGKETGRMPRSSSQSGRRVTPA